MTDTKKRTTLKLPARPTQDEPAAIRRAPVRASGVLRSHKAPARKDTDSEQTDPQQPRTRPTRASLGENTTNKTAARRDRPAFPRKHDEASASTAAPKRQFSRQAAPVGEPDRDRARRKADDQDTRRRMGKSEDASPTRSGKMRDNAPSAYRERRTQGDDGVIGQRDAVKRPPVPRSATSVRPATSERTDPAGAVRLSKRMAELGLCSRREADEYIERGWVLVDGKVVDELGSKILPGQKIELKRGAAVEQNQRVTILLHKPVGYVSGQAEDGYEPASALITPENQWDGDTSRRHFESRHMRKLAPAGRLDIDSTGLLVLTQDGRIAKQLIGENSEIEKEYLVRVEGPLSWDDLALLNHGLVLDGVELQPAKVSWQNEEQLRFVLREGRKRQIRRMCELVGLKVTALKRIRIGQVKLAKLPPGKWRYLGDHEKF